MKDGLEMRAMQPLLPKSGMAFFVKSALAQTKEGAAMEFRAMSGSEVERRGQKE